MSTLLRVVACLLVALCLASHAQAAYRPNWRQCKSLKASLCPEDTTAMVPYKCPPGVGKCWKSEHFDCQVTIKPGLNTAAGACTVNGASRSSSSSYAVAA